MSTTLAVRRAGRLALVLLASAVVAGGACVAMALAGGTEQLHAGRVVLESVGLFLAATACATLWGADRGATMFGGAVLASLVAQQRFPSWALFPFGPEDPSWGRAGVAWGVIAAVGAVAVVVASRDPCRRPHHAARS